MIILILHCYAVVPSNILMKKATLKRTAFFGIFTLYIIIFIYIIYMLIR